MKGHWMASWRVKVREGPRVERSRYDDAESALAAIEERGAKLQDSARAGAIDLKVRRFEPVQQVTARLELAGPGRLRAGVDVRGDGSVESYTGRLRRQLIVQRGDESAYAALRRTVAS